MDIFSDEEVVQEIRIEDLLQSNDRAVIKITGENIGKRGPGKSDIEKEIIARDAIELGVKKAAEIHDVAFQGAAKYANGLDISDEDTRNRVLSIKNNIHDAAIDKLMQTLNIYDPTCIDKQTDIIKSAGILAGIVEKISSKEKNQGNQVVLHIHGVKQNSVEKYNVIDI